jgi:hypothetical protein
MNSPYQEEQREGEHVDKKDKSEWMTLKHNIIASVDQDRP